MKIEVPFNQSVMKVILYVHLSLKADIGLVSVRLVPGADIADIKMC